MPEPFQEAESAAKRLGASIRVHLAIDAMDSTAREGEQWTPDDYAGLANAAFRFARIALAQKHGRAYLECPRCGEELVTGAERALMECEPCRMDGAITPVVLQDLCDALEAGGGL